MGGRHRRRADWAGGRRRGGARPGAVVSRPGVLLLEEPLTALDAKLKETLRDELAQLLRQLRITAVHVTHDQQEAIDIANPMALKQAAPLLQVLDVESLDRPPPHPSLPTFPLPVNTPHPTDHHPPPN